MPDEQEIERSGIIDRRACLLHRGEMDDLAKDVKITTADSNKTNGRFTAMLWFLGVIGTLLSGGMITLITKTSDIQTMLNKTDVTLMQHTERIDNLRKDVDEIKTRNRYIDQTLKPSGSGIPQ